MSGTGVGFWIIAPYGESTGSGFSGTIPPGSVIYHATGATAMALLAGMNTNNANPVTINGKKYEAVMGPFASRAEAKAAAPDSALGAIGTAIGAGIGAAANPGDPGVIGAGAAAGSAAGSAANSTLGGIEAIGHFFNDLGNPQLWIRIGKVVAGLTLLMVGLIKLTGADQKVGGVASKAVKIAPFL